MHLDDEPAMTEDETAGGAATAATTRERAEEVVRALGVDQLREQLVQALCKEIQGQRRSHQEMKEPPARPKGIESASDGSSASSRVSRCVAEKEDAGDGAADLGRKRPRPRPRPRLHQATVEDEEPDSHPAPAPSPDVSPSSSAAGSTASSCLSHRSLGHTCGKTTAARPGSSPVSSGAKPQRPTVRFADEPAIVLAVEPHGATTTTTKSSSSSSGNRTTLNLEWGTLFSDSGEPTPRLSKILRGLASYLVCWSIGLAAALLFWMR